MTATITQGFLSLDPNNPFGFVPPATTGGMWGAPSPIAHPSPVPLPDPFGYQAPFSESPGRSRSGSFGTQAVLTPPPAASPLPPPPRTLSLAPAPLPPITVAPPAPIPLPEPFLPGPTADPFAYANQLPRETVSPQFTNLLPYSLDVNATVLARDTPGLTSFLARLPPDNPTLYILGDRQDAASALEKSRQSPWKEFGSTLLEGISAPSEHLFKPAFGVISGLTEAERKPIFDAEGRIVGYYRDPGIADALSIPKAIGKLIVDPIDQWREGRQATREYFANPDMPVAWKVAGEMALDPLNFIPPLAAARGAKALNILSDVVSTPRRVAAGSIIGAGAGAQLADVFGLEGPAAAAAAIGGALAGGVGVPAALSAASRGASNILAAADAAPPPAALPAPAAGTTGSSTIKKITPGPVVIDTAKDLEGGVRQGTLLRLRTAEQLPENYSVDDVLKVAQEGKRQAASIATLADNTAAVHWKTLGPIVKGEDGNFYFKGIAPSAAEERIGAKSAIAARVLERPDDYLLTPAQRDAVEKLTAIPEKIAQERELFGNPVARVALDEGQQFFWRDVEIEAASPRRPAGGRDRLVIRKDMPRFYKDIADGVANGVQYKDPRVVFRNKIEDGLQNAVNAHVRNLLLPLSQTPMDRMPRRLIEQRAELARKIARARYAVRRAEQEMKVALRTSTEISRIQRREVKFGFRVARTIGEMGKREQMLRGRIDPGAVPRLKQSGQPSRTIIANAIRSAMAESGAAEVERAARVIERLMISPSPRANTVGNLIIHTSRQLQRLVGKRLDSDKTLQQVRAQLDEASRELKEFRRNWDAAMRAARVDPTRRTLDTKAVPALTGRDFTHADANKIERYYSSGLVANNQIGSVSRIIAGINRFITPLNATGDMSVSMVQLGLVAGARPGIFAKNFVKVLGDVFSDQNYQNFLRQTENQGAARWITLLDEGSHGINDFILNRHLYRLPGFRQAQNHFVRFGNRMRIDLFNHELNLLRAAGQPVDEGVLSALGRQIDRATGISYRRAGDLEQWLLFAPNWLRARIENVAIAVGNRTLEGQLARQYFKNYLTLGSMLVLGSALASDRDLRDVFTPISVRDGRFTLNPNFMRVRVAGNDVAVFGAYDSLVRMMVVAADAAVGAITEKDAMQLFDVIGYLSSTIGSPLVKIVNDFIQGETFSGRDPLDPIEVLKRFLPITAAASIDTWRDTGSLGQTLSDAAFGFFGVKASPLTLNELLSEAAGGRDFWSLPKEERDAILANHPDLKKRVEDRQKKALEKSREIIETFGKPAAWETIRAIDEQTTARLEGLAQQWTEGKFAGQEHLFRYAVSDIWRDRREQRALISDVFNLFQKTGKLPDDPIKAAEALYFDLVTDDAWRDPVTGNIADYEAYEAAIIDFKSKLTPEQRAHIEEIEGRREMPQVIAEYYETLERIQATGFYDMEYGRLAFLRNHPEVVPLLERYGFSKDTTRMFRMEEEYRQAQAESDRRLAAGEITIHEWRKDLDIRLAKLAGARELLYGDMDRPGEEGPVAEWARVIREATRPDQTIDWDKVAAWEEQQPPDVIDAIRKRERLILSDDVAEMQQVRLELRQAGFWEMYDAAWQQFIKQYPQFRFWTYDEWRTGVIREKAQLYMSGGYPPNVAYARAEQEVDSGDVVRKVSSLKNRAIENQWLQDNPQLAYDAWKWGFFTPNKTQRRWFDELLLGGFIEP